MDGGLFETGERAEILDSTNLTLDDESHPPRR